MVWGVVVVCGGGACFGEDQKTKKRRRRTGQRFEHLAKSTYCTQVIKENLQFIPPAQPFTKASPTDRETSLRESKDPAGSSLHIRAGRLTTVQSIGRSRFILAGVIRGRGEPEAFAYACLPFSYGGRRTSVSSSAL